MFIFTSLPVVDALIPVSYTCCKNFVENQGKLLDGFEDFSIWTFEGSNNSYISVDKINFKEGEQGLKLVAKNGSKVVMTRYISENFANTKNFVFDLYVHNPNSGRLVIYFTSNKNWSKYFYYGVGTKTKGWNKFVIPKTDIYNQGGEDWNNTMVSFRLAFYPVAGKNTDITIDNFKYDLLGRPKVIFTFDDGTVGDLDAETILAKNNQKAMSFIVINQTTYNSQYYMNLDNIKKLQSSGWDISSHTISHPHLDSLDNDSLTAELNDSYDWLVNHGFQKTAGFLAYPYGSYNDIVIEKTKQRYILARSTDNGVEPHLSAGYENLYKLKIMSIHNTTSVQSVKDRINFTIDQGLLTILNFHRIVDKDPTIYEYSKSDLQQISDYIKSKDRDIDVVTLSDYLNENIINYKPIINKTVRIYCDGTVDLLTNNKYDEYMPNMTVEPSSGHIDITINKYEDQLILFNETVYNPSAEVRYSIGDRVANQDYSIKTYLNNGLNVRNIYVKANDTGYINYLSKKFDKSSYTEIKPYFSRSKENNVLTEASTDISDSTSFSTRLRTCFVCFRNQGCLQKFQLTFDIL